jgi:hypothetical protein
LLIRTKAELIAAAVTFFALLFAPSAAHAAPKALASPVPSPSPSPSAPSDPCGSILSIVTRPTVTTSVCTVRYGHALLETGYTNTVTTGAQGGSTPNYAQPLARIGVAQHLEFDLAPPSYGRTSVGGPTTSGWSDTQLGAKFEVGYTSKAVWGLNAAVSLPTGSAGFTAGAPQYIGNANWSYSFNSEFGAAGTLGFNSFAAANAEGQLQRYFAFAPTVEFTAATGAASQAFAEYAFFSHSGPGLGSKSIIDIGFQGDPNPHLQCDVEYGFQPTPILGQRQHYIGAGLSFMT